MNPELPSNPREELELRVTALLLGELSEAEAAAVRAALANDPELQKLHDDLKQTIHLVREASISTGESTGKQSEPLKLSVERRDKLLARFKTIELPAPASPARRKQEWLVPAAVAATLLAVAGAWMVWQPRYEQLASLDLNDAEMPKRAARATPVPGIRHEAAKGGPEFAEGLKLGLDLSAKEDDSGGFSRHYNASTGNAALPSPAPPLMTIALPATNSTAPSSPFVARYAYIAGNTGGGGFGDSPTKTDVNGTKAESETRSGPTSRTSARELAADQWQSGLAGTATVSTDSERRRAVTVTDEGTADYIREVVKHSDQLAAANRTPASAATAPDSETWKLSANLRGFHDDSYATARPPSAIVLPHPAEHGGDSLQVAGEIAGPQGSVGDRSKQLAETTSDTSLFASEPGRTSDFGTAATATAPDSAIKQGFASPNGDQSHHFQFGVGYVREFGSAPPVAESPGSSVTDGREGNALATKGLRAGDTSGDVSSVRREGVTEQSSLQSGGMGGGGSRGGGRGSVGPSGAGFGGANGQLALNDDLNREDQPSVNFDLQRQSGANGLAATDGTAARVWDESPAANLGSIVNGTSTVVDESHQDASGGTLKMAANDKVPVLGDLPSAGSFFRSESTTLPSTRSPASRPANKRVTIDGKQYEQEFLGYDDPGGFVPQAQSGGGGAGGAGGVGLPLTAQMPVPHYRLKPIEQSVAADSSDASSPNVPNSGSLTLDGGNTFSGGATVVTGGTLAMNDQNGPANLGEEFIPQAQSVSGPTVEVKDKLNGKVGSDTKANTQAAIQAGKQLYEQGKYDEAEGLMQEVLKSEPGNYAAAYYSSLAKEQLHANATLARGTQTKAQILSVEKALEMPTNSKPADSGNGLSARFANPTPRASESPARGSRGAEIALPSTASPAKPEAAKQKVFVYAADNSDPSTVKETLERLFSNQTEPAHPPMPVPRQGLNAIPPQTEPTIEVGSVSTAVDQTTARAAADAAQAEAAQPYFEKKRELDDLLASKKVLETRLAMEKVDVTLPRTGMVTVMDPATPPTNGQGFFARIGQALGGDYQASARIKMDRNTADISEFSDRKDSGVYDPYFVQTEFEAIKSEAVLTNVVAMLDLTDKWGTNRSGGKPLKTAGAMDQLRHRLELKPVANSTMIEITAKDANPQEAAKIANAVAEAYRNHRLTELKQASEGGIKALETRYAEQRASIDKASRELAELRTKLNISDSEAAGLSPEVNIDAPLPRKPSTNAPIPQPEVQTSANNFSTFSLNVSDVSFKLAAASLEKGQMPDPASVRSEEFINAFDYRDPEPPAGAPIAFAWERARYPFTHNRDLLRFSLKTAALGRQAGRPLNLVLLLDNSGSMERADRVQIIREALHVLASQLHPQDKVSVITFARTARLVADGVSGDQAGKVMDEVSGLTPEGGTNLGEAMRLAYATAARHYLANGMNRVVLLTDGAANLGDVEPESLKQQVDAHRQQGIALDCFGIGWEGFNDDLLEVLSRNGDGRYGFINSPDEAATGFASQLAGALKVAASDVKVQVEFNPKRVTAYRQIGYAKHQLTKEQFRDNTVDAAEIAAQEAGNALYTVEVNPAGEGPLGTVRVRYKVPGTTEYHEQSWDVPYTGNAVSLDQASPAMRLAASASAFSEWLVASPFAGEVTLDELLRYLNGVPEAFGADPRPKKLEWMIRQAKSLEGK